MLKKQRFFQMLQIAYPNHSSGREKHIFEHKVNSSGKIMFFREYMFDSYSFFFFVLNFHFLCVPRKLFPFYFHIERCALSTIPSTLSCSVSRFLCTSRLKGFRVIPLSSCRGKVFTHIL